MKMEQQTTFKRDWSQYNAAQTEEKLLFMRLLSDAVDSMGIGYSWKGNGRPPKGMEDMLKCCVIKVFNGFSQRRTIPDLYMAKGLGYIHEMPHFNSISNYLGKPEMTECLERLYKIFALPFASVEQYFAADSTGFGRYNTTWTHSKNLRNIGSFNKLHIITGVRTNIIPVAFVTNAREADSPKFLHLLRETCKRFTVREIYADSGYLSHSNASIAENFGAVPYIMPKKNSRYQPEMAGIEAWDSMMQLWKGNEEEFRRHYHLRSNVESTFSAMKRKFLPYIRSKRPVAQKNEILAKVCCHNASVLTNAVFALDLQAKFKDQEQ